MDLEMDNENNEETPSEEDDEMTDETSTVMSEQEYRPLPIPSRMVTRSDNEVMVTGG